MFMCVVSVTITYASNTHAREHAAQALSNIRWNSLDDHRFFFFLSHIRFFHYAFRVMILLFWLAAIASFPLLNIQKVPQYIICSRRVFCFSADSRTMSHCQHCSFHNQDHRGHGHTGRVSHDFEIYIFFGLVSFDLSSYLVLTTGTIKWKTPKLLSPNCQSPQNDISILKCFKS